MAKEIKDPLDGDFSWVATKEPSEVAKLHAALITQLTGVEITPTQVGAVLTMHARIQASEANRKRAGYVPRTAQSIRKGGETTVERMDVVLGVNEVKAVEAEPKAPAKKAAPKPGPRKPRTPAKKAEPVQTKTDQPEVTVESTEALKAAAF